MYTDTSEYVYDLYTDTHLQPLATPQENIYICTICIQTHLNMCTICIQMHICHLWRRMERICKNVYCWYTDTFGYVYYLYTDTSKYVYYLYADTCLPPLATPQEAPSCTGILHTYYSLPRSHLHSRPQRPPRPPPQPHHYTTPLRWWARYAHTHKNIVGPCGHAKKKKEKKGMWKKERGHVFTWARYAHTHKNIVDVGKQHTLEIVFFCEATVVRNGCAQWCDEEQMNCAVEFFCGTKNCDAAIVTQKICNEGAYE